MKGIDDAVAIIFALLTLDVQLITLVQGNTNLMNTLRNLRAILTVAKRYSDSIQRPFSKPRIALGRGTRVDSRPCVYAHAFHGPDGLGGYFPFRTDAVSDDFNAADIESAHVLPDNQILSLLDVVAEEAILECIQMYDERDVTLIALGPLSNVWRAIELKGNVFAKLKALIIMGGTFDAPGNVSSVAEFNFYADPMAAHLVVAKSTAPVRIVPLDTTSVVGRLEKKHVESCYPEHRNSPITEFLTRILGHAFEMCERARSLKLPDGGEQVEWIAMHDPLCVAAVIDEGLLNWKPTHFQVEPEGRFTAGARFVRHAIRAYWISPLKNIPGPLWAPLMGQNSFSMLVTAVLWFKKPAQNLALFRKYGSVVRVANNVVWISNGELARQLLQSDAIVKHRPVYEILKFDDLGDSLISFIDHGLHQVARRAVMPGFSIQHLKAVDPYIESNTAFLLNMLKERCATSPKRSTDVDIWKTLRTFTTDIIGDVAFGGPFGAMIHGGAEVEELMSKVVENKIKLVMYKFLPMICVPLAKENVEKTRRIVEIMSNIVDERLSGKCRRDDLLQVLVDGRPADGNSDHQSLNRKEIMSNCLLFLTAGVDTSSRMMSFVLIMLLRHPEVLKRVRHEVDVAACTHKIDFSSKEVIPAQVCKSLTYLTAVVNETMRLHGLLSMARVATKDINMCGYHFPKGTILGLHLFSIGRDQETWDRSDTFDPERFMQTGKNEGERNFGFLPFSAGNYSCVGRHMAMTNMRTLLANLLYKFDISDVNPHHSLELVMRGILAIKETPYMVRLTDRNA
ncbi:hypothetical protein SeMB42_g03141 [Synchytrium endobioticum]|uniref:Inosine/uridine-preferring nucleoside hydrolase domain-containing protein n=1 Tax=Synchytrium endobioticum TaxID=286115 RepID=A0A507D9E1_9FUNG|nr:hypothetical protein SeMB42_g03141 [Synchytrium endobioticum]